MASRVILDVGSRVLMSSGVASVVDVGGQEVTLRLADGTPQAVGWSAFTGCTGSVPRGPAASGPGLEPTWSRLTRAQQGAVLGRLEIVQEVLTGHRSGLGLRAAPDEPRLSFGRAEVSVRRRAEDMAALLRGQPSCPAAESIRKWVAVFEDRGVLGLVDQRWLSSAAAPNLDPVFREILDEEVSRFNGDASVVTNQEVLRRARVAWRERTGRKAGYGSPGAARRYLNRALKGRGTTSAAQRSSSLRHSGGYEQYPALRPGQVVAIDATRADVLVVDPQDGTVHSVEILAALDVASRVVVALRVVAKSADSVDAGLLLYDVMRPFALTVSGTESTGWRWAGMPEALEVGGIFAVPDGQVGVAGPLDGEYPIPAVVPSGIRVDHGSIFTSTLFVATLQRWGIDLMLSRGSRPTDNAHVERFHGTLAGALQRVPGYKGPNVGKRGRKVAAEDLWTVEQLREYLHRWVCLEYHRTRHEGLVVPGHPAVTVTPLQMFDALTESAGRMDLPSDPDLMYQFLPVRWYTVRHHGIEIRNLAYDSPMLNGLRSLPKGAFRARDNKVPFFYDPHDVSRVWLAHPEQGRVVEIPWRGAGLLDGPLTAKTRDALLRQVLQRGGARAVDRGVSEEQVLAELYGLTAAAQDRRKALVAAARLRVADSRADHAQAQAAITAAPGTPAEVVHLDDFDRFLSTPWPDYGQVV